MAEHHYGYQQRHPTDTIDTRFKQQQQGQSTSKLLAVLTLFPVGGLCLLLSGLTLAGTLIGLAVATPLFVVFSPILFPAVVTIGLAVTGFLASGAFGVSALSALAYIVNYFRRMGGGVGEGGWSAQEQLEYAKRRGEDTAGFVGQKVKDMGQKVKDVGHRNPDAART